MNEQKRIEGKWWVFGTSKDPEYGVLVYAPETGLELSVKVPCSNTVEDISGHKTAEMSGAGGVIHGEDEHRNSVTLYGCQGCSTSSSSGLKTLNYRPIYALLGRRFESWVETQFDHILTEFTLLHAWMGRTRLSIDNRLNEAPTVTIANPKAVEVSLPNGVKMLISPTFAYHHDQEKLNLEEGHQIEFRFPKCETVQAILNAYVSPFRRLLSLFAGEPVFIDRVFFSSENDRITLMQKNKGVSKAERNSICSNMLVGFPDIKDAFAQVVQKWYAIEKELCDTLNLYFATIFNPTLYSNQRFLFLAQALEVYHRANPYFNGYVQPKEEFKERKKRILEAVPDEKLWLQEKLAHANEKTLAQRLEELLHVNSAVSPKFIQDSAAFSDAVRHTRNHFTHYTGRGDKMDKVATGTALMKLTDQMQALLEICIFKELGVTEKAIDRLVQNLNARQYFTL